MAAEEPGRILCPRVHPGPADALPKLLSGTSCCIASPLLIFVWFPLLRFLFFLSNLCCCVFICLFALADGSVNTADGQAASRGVSHAWPAHLFCHGCHGDETRPQPSPPCFLWFLLTCYHGECVPCCSHVISWPWVVPGNNIFVIKVLTWENCSALTWSHGLHSHNTTVSLRCPFSFPAGSSEHVPRGGEVSHVASCVRSCEPLRSLGGRFSRVAVAPQPTAPPAGQPVTAPCCAILQHTGRKKLQYRAAGVSAHSQYNQN